MTVEFRPIGDGDVKAVVALWQRCGLTVPWNDPHRDIATARSVADADVLVGEDGGTLVASVMVGYDGHRGWLYYLAADPDRQGQGLGRATMAAAEAWFAARGVPKAELMVRRTNDKVHGFYQALGWTEEPVTVFSRRFDDTPPLGAATVETVVTTLEMTERPTRPATHPPAGLPTALVRARTPTVAFYRWLYGQVGAHWTWMMRRLMTDGELRAAIEDPAVEIYVLHIGGVPAGYGEVDRRKGPDDVDLAYFGLMPEFIGRGYGRYLLDAVIDLAWSAGPCERLRVQTCDLDHPRALGVYQKAGFRPVGQHTATLSDPRLVGLPLPTRHAPSAVDVPAGPGATVTPLRRPGNDDTPA